MTDHKGSVVVAGWVGSNNIGDELIHRSMLRELKTLGLEPRSVSQDPAASEATHDVVAFRSIRLWSELGQADGFVFGGGALIQQDSSLLNIAFHFQRLRLAHMRSVPAVGAGLGIGSLRTPTARRAVRSALRKLRRIAVRDHDSQETLRRLGVGGVEVGCDLVFAMDTPDVAAEDVVAVGLRPPLAGGIVPPSLRHPSHSDEWLTEMANALDRAAAGTGLTIRFIAMDRERDHGVHLAVAERMNSSAETLRPGIDEVIGEFAKAQVTIGMRYHAAVVSLVAGRPAVGLDYAQKVSSLASESLGAVVNQSLATERISDIPASMEKALSHAGRVEDMVAAQRLRLAVVRSVLGELVS